MRLESLTCKQRWIRSGRRLQALDEHEGHHRLNHDLQFMSMKLDYRRDWAQKKSGGFGTLPELANLNVGRHFSGASVSRIDNAMAQVGAQKAALMSDRQEKEDELQAELSSQQKQLDESITKAEAALEERKNSVKAAYDAEVQALKARALGLQAQLSKARGTQPRAAIQAQIDAVDSQIQVKSSQDINTAPNIAAGQNELDQLKARQTALTQPTGGCRCVKSRFHVLKPLLKCGRNRETLETNAKRAS